jgi:hypothetical protein
VVFSWTKQLFSNMLGSEAEMEDGLVVSASSRSLTTCSLLVPAFTVGTKRANVSYVCQSSRKHTHNALGRAVDAPAVRRRFAYSPRDPRYHMLEYLSSKFRAEPAVREPRAAIILNRFSRTLTVMYATDAIEGILGVTAEQFKEKSFYECIHEDCLPDAIRCLESAKANDSIAYLRFWYRDPRRAEDFEEGIRQASTSSDSEDGGVGLHEHMDVDTIHAAEASGSGGAAEASSSSAHRSGQDTSSDDAPIISPQSRSNASHRTTSGESSTDHEQDSAPAIFDRAEASRSSTSSLIASPVDRRRARTVERAARPPPVDPFELEAVVSCTSDGLVVILRRARPIIPERAPEPAPVPMYPRGLFAAPWGVNPIRPHQYQPDVNNPFHHGFEAPAIPAGGPPLDDFMNSIREVAAFAWSLAGINGNIASYGHGVPRGEAQPPAGLPVWDPHAQPAPEVLPPINQAEERWVRMDEKANEANNKDPFQHPRQVSDRPEGSTHRNLGNLAGGYVYQGPGSYENNHYDNIFGHGQGRPAAENAQPPATQPQDSAPGPSE